MQSTALKKELDLQWERLPVEEQLHVLQFAQTLSPNLLRGVPGKELLQFAGILSEKEAKAMSQDIHDNCETVDIHEW